MRPAPERDVSAIVKPVPPSTGMSSEAIDSTIASGGGLSRSRRRKSSMAAASPSTSMIAPELSLRTQPGEAERGRGGVHEGPEADSLHHTAHADAQPSPIGHGDASGSRPISFRPAIAASAPARSVFSTTKPMWMITQSPGLERFLGQHADVDLAVLAGDVDERELPAVTLEHANDLSRNPKAHGQPPPVAARADSVASTSATASTASSTAASTSGRQADALVDVLDFASHHHRVRRLAAQRGQAGEHRSRIHAVRVQHRCRHPSIRGRPRTRAGYPAIRDSAPRRRAPGRPTPRAGRRPGACRGCRSPLRAHRCRRAVDRHA